MNPEPFCVRVLAIVIQLSAITVLFILSLSCDAQALNDPQKELAEIGIYAKLGARIDRNIILTTSEGSRVTVGEILAKGRPLVVVPVYYHCPRICGFLLNGVFELINQIKLVLGDDYHVLIVSFDPGESTAQAAEKALKYKEQLKVPPKGPDSLYFTVGTQDQVGPLMQQLGFKYLKDENEFAHSPGLILLTPDGEISQYFTGIDFSAWDVRLALVEASNGSVGSPIDHILLFCYRFDAMTGKYTFIVVNALRISALLSIMGLSAFVYYFSRRARKV